MWLCHKYLTDFFSRDADWPSQSLYSDSLQELDPIFKAVFHIKGPTSSCKMKVVITSPDILSNGAQTSQKGVSPSDCISCHHSLSNEKLFFLISNQLI